MTYLMRILISHLACLAIQRFDPWGIDICYLYKKIMITIEVDYMHKGLEFIGS